MGGTRKILLLGRPLSVNVTKSFFFITYEEAKKLVFVLGSKKGAADIGQSGH